MSYTRIFVAPIVSVVDASGNARVHTKIYMVSSIGSFEDSFNRIVERKR